MVRHHLGNLARPDMAITMSLHGKQPKISCPRCGRVCAQNRDGELRDHFCPHYHCCASLTCLECDIKVLEALYEAK